MTIFSKEAIETKVTEMKGLSKKILDDSLMLVKIASELSAIQERAELIRYDLQQQILLEKCQETGKQKFSNEFTRKSELLFREQNHQPLQMLKQELANHLETKSNLEFMIEFEKRQFQIGEKILSFLAS